MLLKITITSIKNIIAIAIIRKAFKNLNIRLDTINILFELDKFILKAFN